MLLEVLDGYESRVRRRIASRTSEAAQAWQMTAPSCALWPFEVFHQDVVFVLQLAHVRSPNLRVEMRGIEVSVRRGAQIQRLHGPSAFSSYRKAV